MHQFDLTALPLLALYAETHFRFGRFFPSLLYRRSPEVIFDLPRRIGPGQDLPIALIVNDIDRFPASMSYCAITIAPKGDKPLRIDIADLEEYRISHPFEKQQRAYIIPIPRQKLSSGEMLINARITVITAANRSRIVVNDNLPTSSKLPMRCTVADTPLPGAARCSYGDLHCHSQYSQSHVEFGPPITVIDRLAHAMGLSFVGITDHSYDLACSESNYLQQDPELGRWKQFQVETGNPKNYSTIIIPGEEISCLNHRSEVIHLCGLGLRDYVPGTLDGARKRTAHNTQLSIAEAIDAIHAQGGFAFAAHPGAHAGNFQRLMLHRGEWTEPDIRDSLDGFQALNSGFSISWDRGKALWIKALQRGINLPLLAGNDAHGDFNRYRAIHKPFVSIIESFGRYLGYGKTGIYGKPDSEAAILSKLGSGETFVTTGPFIALSQTGSDPLNPPAGSALTSEKQLSISAESTEEFGALHQIKVIHGKIGSAKETVVFAKQLERGCVKFDTNIEPCDVSAGSYLRAEVTCTGVAGAIRNRGFTGAVFIAAQP